jgi:hypothetical protein
MPRSILLAFFAMYFATIAAPAFADTRVALVIGNGAYLHVPHLPNPSNDADDVAAALRRTGFQTIVGKDLDQIGMQNAAIQFARAARTADVAIFYYSGHAMQYGGVNYLFPVDAQLSDEADLVRMSRVDDIVANLKQAKNLRIVVLDACRNNPFADQLKDIGVTRGVSIERGLARMQSQDGTIISYSTQSGRTANDGTGRNSPYTSAFLRHIEDKEDIATVFHRISANVYESTQGTQVPELSLSYFGEFYLNGKGQTFVAPAITPAPLDPCLAANDHWKSAEAIGTVDAFQDHLLRFPNCTFAGLAKARIASLNSKATIIIPPSATVSPPAAAQASSAGVPGSASGVGLSMQECARRYMVAKTANTLNGQKWNDFRRAGCGADTFATIVAPPGPAVSALPGAGEPLPPATAKPQAPPPLEVATATDSVAPVTSPEPQTRTAAAIQCSMQADSRGLHGVERKEFYSECKVLGGRENIVFPVRVFPKYSGEEPEKARMHTCVDQYNENKAANANGSMKWIESGGGYYTECNKRLKG